MKSKLEIRKSWMKVISKKDIILYKTMKIKVEKVNGEKYIKKNLKNGLTRLFYIKNRQKDKNHL